MGGKNKARKTRWRALDIADDHNSDDSEDSNLTNSSTLSPSNRVQSHGYHHSNSRPYYSNTYSYSSQSTPRRRYYEGSTKSTRSSSTTSETKITIIDDEYTRITTPRQDVLFKKGYLNKPRSYQSQTSTGASTISTETSTENGTPDHHSTDLDYESQFVFPNGFVDQNGFYYVNSFDPYPVVLINPPTYFPEFPEHKLPDHKSKRCSTGSLTESMSPNTEEATSQDLSHSGGDTSNNVSDYGGQPLYNLVYPTGYYGGPCPHNGLENGYAPEPVKKLKKRRERKSSKTVPGDSTENTTDDNSSDEASSHEKPRASRQNTPLSNTPNENSPLEKLEENSENILSRENTTNSEDVPCVKHNVEHLEPTPLPTVNTDASVHSNSHETLDEESKTELTITQNGCADPKTDINEDTNNDQAQPINETENVRPEIDLTKSNLKPEAEEFVPRLYHHIPPHPHTHLLPHNFVPIPLVINDYNGQPFAPHQAFIPPGIPISILPHPGQKMFPPVYGPPPHLVNHEVKVGEVHTTNLEKITEDKNNVTRTPESTPNSAPVSKTTIDIATVVSKLEEAVKEREENLKIEEQLQKTLPPQNTYRGSSRFNNKPNYRKNFNKFRFSTSEFPSIGGSNVIHKNNNQPENETPTATINGVISSQENNIKSINREPTIHENSNKIISYTSNSTKDNNHQQDRFRKSYNHNCTFQSNPNSPKRQPHFRRSMSENHEKPNSKDYSSQKSQDNNRFSNKNYSETLRKPTLVVKPLVNEETKVKKNSELSSPVVIKPDQWISVSSRKKKKNKNIEDFDIENSSENLEFEESIPQNEDFETYDVNQLVDVVPPSKIEQENKKIEEILTDLAETINQKCSSIENTPVHIPEVKDIEKDILIKSEEEKIIEDVEKDDIMQENVEVQIEENKLTPEVELEEEKPVKSKKKSKKGTQKPLTRKVIIKDIDLSGEYEKEKKKTEDFVKEVKKETKHAIIEEKKEEIVKETVRESPEKKTKKKKKNKNTKSTLNDAPSESICSSTLDESCELLLEHNILDTSEEKTNLEMTLELDKLIQKSMYSSLKEKIKLVDIDPSSDEFFHKLGASSSNKNGFNKTPDFNKIFQSTRQFLKPNSAEIFNSWISSAADDSHAQPGPDPTPPIYLAELSERNLSKPLDDNLQQPHLDDLSDQEVQEETMISEKLTTNNFNDLPSDPKLSKFGVSKPFDDNLCGSHLDDLLHQQTKEQNQNLVAENLTDPALTLPVESVQVTKSQEQILGLENGRYIEFPLNDLSSPETEVQDQTLTLEGPPIFKYDHSEPEAETDTSESTATYNIMLENQCEDVSTFKDPSTKYEQKTRSKDQILDKSLDYPIEKLGEFQSDDLSSQETNVQHQIFVQESTSIKTVCPSQSEVRILVLESEITGNKTESEDLSTSEDLLAIETELQADQILDLQNSLKPVVESSELGDQVNVDTELEYTNVCKECENNLDLATSEKTIENQSINYTELPDIHNISYIDENQQKLMLAINETESNENKNDSTKNLLPITAAVKNWMARTRENTPEVEILKSPSTIYKEQHSSQEDQDESTEDTDEEIVLFNNGNQEMSRQSSTEEYDLLDYWENTYNTEIVPIEVTSELDSSCTQNEKNDPCNCLKCQNNVIEEGIEVYESKYGQNEAYLSLQKDVKNDKPSAGPKLPGKGVCCNVQ